MNETMIRFNLINGLTYSTTGLDAVESYKAYNTTAEWFDIPHDGKTVRIYWKHIVSVEWRGVDWEYDTGVEVKPKDTKRAINLLIGDIQDNEWYCIQCGSKSELKDWEKELIVTGLRKLLSDDWSEE